MLKNMLRMVNVIGWIC